jgi:6-phosphogluconate dehydrogenase
MESMKIGIIGLGRMGNGIAHRAMKAGYCVLGYDPDLHMQKEGQKIGIQVYQNPEELAREADLIWLMVPAGKIVDTVLAQIGNAVKKGTIIVDGGNSNFADSVRRAKELALRGIHFLDCGVSGGVHGQEQGFCLMVGGSYESYQKIEPLLKVLAPKNGAGYMGPSGAGHYVKMVHNGIEYGILQSYAEGFHLLREGSYKDLDLEKISDVWLHGSVIRSWLLELAHGVFKQDQMLGSIGGKIEEGGTGAWTLENAKQNKIPVPVIEKSLEVRRWSRESGGNFATKVIQMLRNAFGGHKVEIKRENEL